MSKFLYLLTFIVVLPAPRAHACCPSVMTDKVQVVRHNAKDDFIAIETSGELGECCDTSGWHVIGPRGRNWLKVSVYGDDTFVENIGPTTDGLRFAPANLRKAITKNAGVLLKQPDHDAMSETQGKQWRSDVIAAKKWLDSYIVGSTKPIDLKEVKCPIETRKKKDSFAYVFQDPRTQNSIPIFMAENNCVWEPYLEQKICTLWNQAIFYGSPSRTKSHPWGPEEVLPKCYNIAKDNYLVVISSGRYASCLVDTTEVPLRVTELALKPHRLNIEGFRLYKEKKFKEAENKFREALELNPNHRHANFNLACMMAINGKNIEKGKPFLRKLLADKDTRATYLRKIKSDDDLKPWHAKGLSVWADGAAEDAVKAERRNPSPALAANLAGMKAYRKKDYASAIEHFNKAIDLNPQFVIAMTNAASVYALKGQNDLAYSKLQGAMALNPKLTLRKWEQDKDFDRVRNVERFKKLLK